MALLGAAPAQAAQTPLFAAFERFCIDTGAKTEAVAAAVAAAGGKQGPPSFLYPPGAYWQIRLQGEDLTISSETYPPDTRYGPDHQTCLIESERDDAAGVAAIMQWAGFGPSYKAHGAQPYRFVVHGGRRLPVTGGTDPSPADLKDGRVWAVKMEHGRQGTKALLIHLMPVSGRR
ncbi:MAG TPA: hypothetical protein VHZ78_10470 [Rhizomicrobium sp.]|nr:hypothetical protein [Rhizomicrobium sp.]